MEKLKVVGALQLQFHTDVGDLDFPAFLRHVSEPEEAYIEFIAASVRGKGVGSSMLEWAETFSKSQNLTKIAWDVMAANTGAVHLHKRKDFVVKMMTDI